MKFSKDLEIYPGIGYQVYINILVYKHEYIIKSVFSFEKIGISILTYYLNKSIFGNKKTDHQYLVVKMK